MKKNPDKRESTIVKTSIIGIVGNVLLVGFKATIGFIAGSISIVVDALNNLTDVLSSVITIIGTKISNKKPDKKHPFGHGRVEYITSTLVAFLILFAGGLAIYESIKSIIDYFTNKTLPQFTVWSLVIIGVAILVKVGIGVFYKIQGNRVNSSALKASGTDALWDAVLSTGTLIGAIFAYTLGWYVEGYLGILIGLFIIKSGIGILTESFSLIIGERYDKEEINKIRKDIMAIEGVQGAYDLIINNYGPKKNIGSVHIGVANSLTAREVQIIERNITAMMYMKYDTIMTVGIYADFIETAVSKNIHQYLSSIINDNKNILQLHGFFVDEEKKLCNFDIVISFDEDEPEIVVENVKKAMEEKFPEYTFIVTLDSDYSLS